MRDCFRSITFLMALVFLATANLAAQETELIIGDQGTLYEGQAIAGVQSVSEIDTNNRLKHWHYLAIGFGAGGWFVIFCLKILPKFIYTQHGGYNERII